MSEQPLVYRFTDRDLLTGIFLESAPPLKISGERNSCTSTYSSRIPAHRSHIRRWEWYLVTLGRSVADRAQGPARGAAVAAFAPPVLIPRFARDSLLEGRVRSEPVSEIGLFRAILDGNKLVLAPKIAKNRNPGA